MHDVAGIDETYTDAAGDRGRDAGISELELGVVDLALIGGDGAIKLADQCGLCIKLLLGNDAFLKKKFESFEIYLSVSALSLIFGELPQGLCELDLERTRIDLREKVSFVDELAFLEGHTDELTVHATANRDGVESGDRAKTIEIDRQVATLGGGNDYRDDHAASAKPSPALAGCCGRGGAGALAARS